MKHTKIAAVLFIAAMLSVLHCGEDDNGNGSQTGDPDASDTGSGNPDAGPSPTDTGGVSTDTGGVSTDTGGGATDTGTATGGAADSGTQEPSEPDLVVGRVSIPAGFSGTPSIFSVLFFASEAMAGMPDGFGGTTADLTAVTPGGIMEFSSTQAGLTGSYYVAIVLYCEGGGGGMYPVAGVDWIGAAAGAIALGPGTGTIDVGQLELMPSD